MGHRILLVVTAALMVGITSSCGGSSSSSGGGSSGSGSRHAVSGHLTFETPAKDTLEAYDAFYDPDAHGLPIDSAYQFFAFTARQTNRGNDTHLVLATVWELKGDDGTVYVNQVGASNVPTYGKNFTDDTGPDLRPGSKSTGVLVYVIPKTVKSVELTWRAGSLKATVGRFTLG